MATTTNAVVTEIQTAIQAALAECVLLNQSGLMPASYLAMAQMAASLALTTLAVLTPLIPAQMPAASDAEPQSLGVANDMGLQLFNAHLKAIHENVHNLS